MNCGFRISDVGLQVWQRRLLLSSVLCLALLASCSRSPQEAGKGKGRGRGSGGPVPVTVAEAIAKTMPVQVQAVGRVQAFATVCVGCQVDGPVLQKHFVEGQHVKAGELLFTIDSRPYEAQLRQSQANLSKNKAQLENARVRLERNAAVVEKGYVSKDQYDLAVATEAALKASVEADEAAIETAQLRVQYCSIKSPVDGIAGALQVDPGNLVRANDTANPLVVVNQIQPIYVSFSVPERYLPVIKQHMASGKPWVEVSVPGQQGSLARGELTFLDNAVNAASGTIQLRATFVNEDRSLWPGQFVTVALVLAEQPGAVVLPSQAVQTSQKGQYVFVVRPDNTVEDRPVVVNRSIGNESVIESGLKVGERVVTDGHLRLNSGSSIKIVPPVGAGQEKGS